MAQIPCYRKDKALDLVAANAGSVASREQRCAGL